MRDTALVALLALLACSSSSSPGASTITHGDASLACTRASGLADAGVAPAGRCTAARAYVTCTFSDGSGEGCLSDDPTVCLGGSSVVGASNPSCKDQCAASEYGVACGGPGSAQAPSPPAGCRSVGVTPGGVELFCCPCL